jgi:DNA-directed RNA polymerase
MSQESKIDDLRIRLAKALTWLDVPGVSNEQLNKLQTKSYNARGFYTGPESSLVNALNISSRALNHIQNAPENYDLHEHIHDLQFGVNNIESCLKVISPSRIDVISNDLR